MWTGYENLSSGTSEDATDKPAVGNLYGNDAFFGIMVYSIRSEMLLSNFLVTF